MVLEDDDDGADGPSAYEQLDSWIAETAVEKGVTEVGDIDTCKMAKAFGIESKHKTAAVLTQSIFDDKIAKQVEDRAGLLKNMITAEHHKKAFLGGPERFVGQDRPALVAQVPAILATYYQNDLVS